MDELYHGTLDVCMVNKVCKYNRSAKLWIACMLPLRHNSEYSVKYQISY
jgi:hypothetical protein